MRWVLRVAAAVGGLLVAQAAWVRTRRFLTPDAAPAFRDDWGASDATPLRLAVLGDSTAVGLGADDTGGTVAGRLAAALAETGHRVTVDALGVSGSRARDLERQVVRALAGRPDVAVLLIGANDATHLTPLRAVARDVHRAVRRLREHGVAVVVGTCPDMGAAVFPRPLRELVAWQGRRVATATARAARAAGATTVAIAAVGPAFRRDPDRYLSSDRFHPSAAGYGLWAEVLAPAVHAAAGDPS